MPLTKKVAERSVNKWWKKGKFKTPTFFDCYLQGFLAGMAYRIKKVRKSKVDTHKK